MVVEALVRWTEMQFKQEDEAEAAIKRMVSGDIEGVMPQPTFFYDYSPLVFDLNDVTRFNRAHDPEFTTLTFVDGERYVIKYAYRDFQNLYIQNTGHTILSIVPKEWSKDDKVRKGKIPPTPPTDDDIINNI